MKQNWISFETPNYGWVSISIEHLFAFEFSIIQNTQERRYLIKLKYLLPPDNQLHTETFEILPTQKEVVLSQIKKALDKTKSSAV
ncbi:MAG: hypothetical protein KatS3mg087_1524 [Patescibacteria group bacterium]|nr:MAG: hypothetical protein KatS3mg087_1524 [Patescibacteria group bacterium]